jgi:hypothetical protein
MDGIVLARGLLARFDESIARIDGGLLGGAAQDWVGYRELVARRQALLEARTAVVESLGKEGRALLERRPISMEVRL